MESLKHIISALDDTKLSGILLDNLTTCEPYLLIPPAIKIEKLDPVLRQFEWIRELNISSNCLASLENLPEKLQALIVPDNKLENFNGLDLPISIEIIDVASNQITSIINLDALVNLQELSASNNKLNELASTQPDSLFGLDISYNFLTGLDGLNNRIKFINCSFNQIKHITLPDSIVIFNGSNNLFEYIDLRRKNLREVDLSNCSDNIKFDGLMSISTIILD